MGRGVMAQPLPHSLVASQYGNRHLRMVPRMGFSVSGKEFDEDLCNPHLLPAQTTNHGRIKYPTAYDDDEDTAQLASSKSKHINMERRLRDDVCDGLHRSTFREAWSHGQYHSYVGGGGGDYAGGNLIGGLSWPPRSYACSFCKREFRSAQALGGHMNVHRRDRARLRESPPWEPPTPHPDLSPNLSPNPNPSPNLNHNCVILPNLNHEPGRKPDDMDISSTVPAQIPQVTRIFPSLLIPPLTHPSSSSLSTCSASAFSPRPREAKNRRIMKAVYGVGEVKGHAGEDHQTSEVLKRKNGVLKGLNLEIGMSGDPEELDLELRLGYA